MCLTRNILILGLICYLSKAVGGPWFTGPIIARSAHTIPAGHHNLEPYLFYTDNVGQFTRHWNRVHTASLINIQANPLYTFGLNPWMDVQFLAPYTFNDVNRPYMYHHFSDISVLLGFQLINQHGCWPDFRLSISETFPTGKYENIDPKKNDITGLGSYQTTIGFNFQYLYHFKDDHYLRTRFVIDCTDSDRVHVHGRNAYGGFPATTGIIRLGKMVSVDLAFEYTLTRHWVAVMEGYVSHSQANRFSGTPGNPSNTSATIGNPETNEISIAPAIEYNWNENVGIIIGEWFPLIGQNAVDFKSTVVAINIFW